MKLAGSGDLVGELELLVQGGVGDVKLAGSGNLVGELELLVQGRVGNGHLASLALLCRGKALEVSQRVSVGLRQHVSEVGGGALFLDNLAQRLQNSEKIIKFYSYIALYADLYFFILRYILIPAKRRLAMQAQEGGLQRDFVYLG